MGPRRRVVITGLGVIAPNGIGKEAFWKNLVAGKSAVDYIFSAVDIEPVANERGLAHDPRAGYAGANGPRGTAGT